MNMNKHFFGKSKKLCQIIFFGMMLVNMGAHAEPKRPKAHARAKTSQTQAYVEPAKTTTVLFVDGGNTGRSWIAEMIARHLYGKKLKLTTFSRGTGILPGERLGPEEFMAKLALKDK